MMLKTLEDEDHDDDYDEPLRHCVEQSPLVGVMKQLE